MKLITLLLLALMFFVAVHAQGEDAEAEEGDPAVDGSEEGDEEVVEEEVVELVINEMEFSKGAELNTSIKGIGENKVWLIQFFNEDKEDDMPNKILDCLATEKYNDDKYFDLEYIYSEVDISNKKFDEAMTELKMDTSSFQVTYPTVLMMRKRKGLFAFGYDLADAVCERLDNVVDGKIVTG